MASLNTNRMLFFTTSPRTPFKMVPEIELLGANFTGKNWNKVTQVEFINLLVNEGFFNGNGSTKNLDFSARDRINRAPKALGFVSLNPTVCITDAGELFIKSKRKEEILLRQLLKFQLPSPFHTETSEERIFWVKPYLEILRLISHFGSLSFDEIMLFGLQLTNYNKFDEIVKSIDEFRVDKAKYKGKYKLFKASVEQAIVLDVFSEEIVNGKTKTRESNDATLKNFIRTKVSNMRDYTDACFRYLRSTGLVSISQRGKSLYVAPDKQAEIDYILKTIDRNPIFVDDEVAYKEYLYNPTIPALLNDNKDELINSISQLTGKIDSTLNSYAILDLKEMLYDLIEAKKEKIIKTTVKDIKEYKQYSDIVTTFDDIQSKNVVDIPLMLEWNTWRAMTMLDGGEITANLKFDDAGEPMSTAQGNMADIFCQYDDFGLTVEVTTAGGAKQYEMEGEPVSRHLAKFKESIGMDAYCLFIAPKINEACIAQFYMLHKTNIKFYGGKSIIVPIDLHTFRKMLEDSFKASYQPKPSQVKAIFEYSMELANSVEDETEWYEKLNERVLHWLD